MTRIRLGLISMCAALCVAAPAHAQFAPNSNAPTRGSADTADYKPGLTTLIGQVDVRQEETRVLADRMEIYTNSRAQAGTAGAFDDVSRIVATGNFYFINPEQEVRGDKGVYEASTDNFTVTGNVILLQGEDSVVTGNKLIYDLNANTARMVGSCQGRRCGSKGRVNILIKQTPQNGTVVSSGAS